jgi:hypothetical protein
MRILHLITTLDVGGAEMHLLAQTRGQRQRGHDVRVLYLKGQGTLAPDFRAEGAEVVPVAGPLGFLLRHPSAPVPVRAWAHSPASRPTSGSGCSDSARRAQEARLEQAQRRADPEAPAGLARARRARQPSRSHDRALGSRRPFRGAPRPAGAEQLGAHLLRPGSGAVRGRGAHQRCRARGRARRPGPPCRRNALPVRRALRSTEAHDV